MAIQLNFFMAAEDERELFRKLAPWDLDLHTEVTQPGAKPVKVDAKAAETLTEPGYYFAIGEVEGYPIKRGPGKGLWKIDEVHSPVVYFCRSLEDEDSGQKQLRSGYFWCELEQSGDTSRMGGKPDKLRRLFLEVKQLLKSRYRTSNPQGYAVGPHAARLHASGILLREAGRKGELIAPYR